MNVCFRKEVPRNFAMRAEKEHGAFVRVAREKASCYFRRREGAAGVQDLFVGGLAARKARRGALGSENAPADGDRVGAGGGTCSGGVHQNHHRGFYPNHNLGIHVDLAGDFSLEGEKAPSAAQPGCPAKEHGSDAWPRLVEKLRKRGTTRGEVGGDRGYKRSWKELSLGTRVPTRTGENRA
jgi:hypothetical protein